MAEAVRTIKENPDSRRIIVSSWNVADLDNMNLPPCHSLFQFYVNDGKLSPQLYQRSADSFLGVPFNIASYALLTMMTAQVCGLQAGSLSIHSAMCISTTIILSKYARSWAESSRRLPVMRLNPEVTNLFKFKYEDFTLEGYDPPAAIKGEVSV